MRKSAYGFLLSFLEVTSVFYLFSLCVIYQFPHWIGLDVSLDIKSLRLVQGYFGLTALTMLYQSAIFTRRASSAIEAPISYNEALWILPFIFVLFSNCALSYNAYDVLGFERPWLLALFLPPIIHIAHMMQIVSAAYEYQKHEAEKEEVREGEETDSPAEIPILDPDSFRIDPNFGLNIVYLFGLTIGIVLLAVVLAVGFSFYAGLEYILVHNESYDVVRAIPRVVAVLTRLPELYIYLLVVPAFFGAIWMVSSFAQVHKLAGTQDANRELSVSERLFIEHAFDETIRFIDQLKFRWIDRLYILIMYGLMIASFMAGPAAVAFLILEAGQSLETARSLQGAVFYESAYFSSAVPAFVFGLAAWYWLINQWIKLDRSFGDYLYVKASWNTAEEGERSPADYLRDITELVRLRLIHIDQKYEPSDFLRISVLQYDRFVRRIVVYGLLGTLFLFGFDVNTFVTVSPEKIRYSAYFQISTTTAEVTELSHVSVQCGLYKKQDDGTQKAGFGYILILPNGISVDILPSESDPFDNAGFARLHRNLLDAGVPIEKSDSLGWFVGRDGYLDNCAEIIEQKAPEDRAETLKTLLLMPFADESPI